MGLFRTKLDLGRSLVQTADGRTVVDNRQNLRIRNP